MANKDFSVMMVRKRKQVLPHAEKGGKAPRESELKDDTGNTNPFVMRDIQKTLSIGKIICFKESRCGTVTDARNVPSL